MPAIDTYMDWNKGIHCNFLKIIHNYLILLCSYHLLVHFLIISRSTDLITNYIEFFHGVRGEVIWKKNVGHWGSYGLKQGNPLQFFKNHSQLPNIIILWSVFGSLYHHFKVHRFDIWLYWGFYGLRGEVICEKVLAIEAATAWNRGIPWIF